MNRMIFKTSGFFSAMASCGNKVLDICTNISFLSAIKSQAISVINGRRMAGKITLSSDIVRQFNGEVNADCVV